MNRRKWSWAMVVVWLAGGLLLVAETEAVLLHALETVLRALHPMMPHITEEIWQRVPKSDDAGPSIMVAPYPVADRDALAKLPEGSVGRAFLRFAVRHGLNQGDRVGNADRWCFNGQLGRVGFRDQSRVQGGRTDRCCRTGRCQ